MLEKSIDTEKRMPSTLPPLREIIKEFNLSANKSLGQNYLMDLNLTGKIASLAGDLEGTTVIEIGPGPCGLTRSLLEQNPAKVISVEIDNRFVPALKQIKDIYKESFEFFCMDGLDFDYSTLANKPTKIVANLPYNSASKFLVQWLLPKQWPPFWSGITLLLQKEVGERVTAQPNSKTYGRLSILSQLRSDAKILMNIPAQAFTPVPKVDSVVVQILPKPSLLPVDAIQLFEKVIAMAFNQRRKMIKTSLKKLPGNIVEYLEQAEIDPMSRPEQIPVTKYIKFVSIIQSQVEDLELK